MERGGVRGKEVWIILCSFFFSHTFQAIQIVNIDSSPNQCAIISILKKEVEILKSQYI